MNSVEKKTSRFSIGDRVSIIGSGQLVGLIVDFVDGKSYTVAFPPLKGSGGYNHEFIFDASLLIRK